MNRRRQSDPRIDTLVADVAALPSRHWTVEAYVTHNEAMRSADEKFQVERDRRYAEVKNAEEKALKVKEEADKAALGLAREIQTYKDEKANELREQINSERGRYATQSDLKAAVEKIEVTMIPMSAFVAAQSGRNAGIGFAWQLVVTVIGLAISAAVYFK